MSNLNLKGLWIPIEILTDTNLSDKEKHIYSIVMFLSKENNYCYCTNSNISELLNISITQVSKLVNSLKKKGYIDIEIKYKDNSKEIESRKLIPKMNTLPNKTSIPLLKKSLKIINIIIKYIINIIMTHRILRKQKLILKKGHMRDLTLIHYTQITV